MTAWLTIIGIGLDGRDGLSEDARAALDNTEIIAGSKRQLDLADIARDKRHEWPSPFSIDGILDRRGEPTAVLASGDPMHYGIGASFSAHFGADEMRVIPKASAFSLAAARLGWPLQSVDCVSLHGRPGEALHRVIQPGARILALTGGGETIAAALDILRARDYGQSRVWVLENMGGDDETIIETNAADGASAPFGELNTLAIECKAGPDAEILPVVPGLDDEAFEHDGMLTKREVRALTLAALAPGPGRALWDVGAGCGSIAIEWMRAARDATAIAFERNKKRIAMIERNARALGVPDLAIVAGSVPDTLSGQAFPDAVFIGGAVTGDETFNICWQGLSPGGILVANAVTLEAESVLYARHAIHGGRLTRIEISNMTRVGGRRAMRPRMPVTQWRVVKP